MTLRKLVTDHESYLHGIVAYFSSGIISAGPWLISVISLAFLQGIISAGLSYEDRLVLFATITYSFVISLILMSPIQIVLTRAVADHFFLEQTESVAGVYTQSLIVSMLVSGVVIVPFVLFAPFDVLYKLLASSLFLTVALAWLMLAILSAVRDYGGIVAAYVIGYGLSCGGALWLSRPFGLEGALAGFTFGQMLCLSLLNKRIFAEFPETSAERPDLYRHLAQYWMLALIGLLYYGGLWAEKMYYWSLPASTIVQGFYRTFPPYDSAIFLAYLLTIPASAVFLVNLETNFYQHYRAFYSHILRRDEPDLGVSGGTFSEITDARLAMIKAVRSGIVTLIKVQGMITALAWLLAPDLGKTVGLSSASLQTLYIALLAASGQVFVLYAMLLLLYLDARMQALLTVSAFSLGNIGLTIMAERLAPGMYGLGYLFSTLIGALLGIHLLNTVLSQLDYLTFMLQPVKATRVVRPSRVNPLSTSNSRPHPDNHQSEFRK